MNKKQLNKELKEEASLEDQLEDILETANARFTYAEESWREQRRKAQADLSFYTGDQWEMENSPARREPQITVNRLPQFVKQVESAIRSQVIGINVYPTDEIGSEDTANIIGGMIRHIERKSDAQSQYINAIGENGALVSGFGFLKLETTYCNAKTNMQEVIITSPKDPFKILPDPDAIEMDSRDAKYWFEVEDYSLEQYNNLFPQSSTTSFDKEPFGAVHPKWKSGDNIRVAKYWYKVDLTYTQYLLADGTEITSLEYRDPNEDSWDEGEFDDIVKKDWPKDENGTMKPVLRSREIVTSQIKWAILNGAEVLDRGDWPGPDFPFVSVYGPTVYVNGNRDIRGLIRYAKDSQRMLNYMASSAIRRIGSANKAPWIADIKSIKGYEKYWKSANTENWSVLPYNSVDPDNPQRQLPPPTRADQTGQVNDLILSATKFENDLKATIGIYDAGLGATPNEQSGVAIKTLAQQGQDSNIHFSSGIESAVGRLGQILVRLIPKVYDTPRVVRIIGADNQEKMVRINEMFDQSGESNLYDLSQGEYGVGTSTGPSYASRKQQSLDQIIRLSANNPSIIPLIQDILVGQMDFEQAPAIQTRLRKLLAITSPQLVEQDDGKDLPPQAQAAMAQLSGLVEKLTSELQATQQELQQLQLEKMTKVVEHQGQMELVKAKTAAEIELALIRAQADAQAHNSKIDADMVKARMDHTQKLTSEIIKNPGLMGE